VLQCNITLCYGLSCKKDYIVIEYVPFRIKNIFATLQEGDKLVDTYITNHAAREKWQSQSV
jgi:hypothetical protein